MGLLGHAMFSMPLQRYEDGEWRPVDSVRLLRVSDPQSFSELPGLVQSLVQDSLSRGALHWHRAIRHVPSVSTFCSGEGIHAPPTQEHRESMHVSDPVVDSTFVVKQLDSESQNVPLFGFVWGAVGDAQKYCPCGWLASGMCVLDAEACVDAHAPCLQALCQTQHYSPSQADAVEACLVSAGAGVRCLEMGPSDLWGLFPVDCGADECLAAAQWSQTQFPGRMTWEGIRLLSEGRAGWKLPNYEHVNATFHEAIHHGERVRPVRDFRQPNCVSEPDDNDILAVHDFVSHLFPAAQLVHDSPAVADCTRYVVELARTQALAHVSLEASEAAALMAIRWKQRCAAQSRQLSVCAFLGVYYDVRPPPEAVQCGSLRVVEADQDTLYLTPDCVAVDRLQRRMYDAHACTTTTLLQRQHLQASCELRPQPLELVHDRALLSLRTEGATPIVEDPLADCLDLKGLLSLQRSAAQQVSEVLDWWPDVPPPTGYHVTAATVLDELAPMLFDNHWAFDDVSKQIHYVHTALRSEAYLHNTVGATGLCRRHNVGMPLFDADTNRVCTRARKTREDTPQRPTRAPLDPPGVTWLPGEGYSDAYMAEHFEDEQCAPSANDVPWEPTPHDRLTWAVGMLPGWHARMSMSTEGLVQVAPLAQPKRLPLPASALGQWGDNCSQTVQWGTAPACGAGCAFGTTCLRLRANESSEVCYPVAQAADRNPCFAGHHCNAGLVCLADGACEALHLHVWNSQTFDMEVASVADDCGLLEQVAPYVQTTLGASPWEWVPDLLHVHGFCAHHRWFTYNTGLNATTTCRSMQDEATARCNASQPWPWGYTFPDGKTAPSTTKAKLAGNDGGVLRVTPHTCDAAFMHLATPEGKRLKLCAATRDNSRSAARSTVQYYGLSTNERWEQVPNMTHWMRSTDASGADLLLAVPTRFSGPLGFLGGIRGDSDPIVHSLGLDRSKVRFFRCKDKLACAPPPFHYNGLLRNRTGLLTSVPQSERSLRRCGPMGQLWPDEDAERAVCLLDQPLFPILSQAVWEPDDMTNCKHLWSTPTWVTKVESVPKTPPQQLEHGRLYCYRTVESPCPYGVWTTGSLECQCLYQARLTTVLTSDSETDHIADMQALLNTPFTEMRTPTLSSLTERYEATMSCFSRLADYIKFLHGDDTSGYQTIYGSSHPAGLYVAFRLALYEVPLPWLLDVALATLVPHLVPPPPLSQGLKTAFDRFGRLQQGTEWDSFCDTLVGRERLIALWCGPSTTQRGPLSPVHLQHQSVLIGDLMDEVAHNLSTKFGVENPNLHIVCHQAALWRCEDPSYVNASLRETCMLARRARNSPTDVCEAACRAADMATPFANLKSPCEAPDRYFMQGPVEVTNLASLAPGTSFGTDSNFGEYLSQVKEQLLDSAAANVVPYDYAAEILSTPEEADESPVLLHVWPVSLQDQQSQLSMDVFFRTACDLSLRDTPIDTCVSSFDTWEERPYVASDKCVEDADEDVEFYFKKAKDEHDGEEQTTEVKVLLEGSETWNVVEEMCPFTQGETWKGRSLRCYLQPHASVPFDANLQPGRIKEVRVPPGVGVALFGLYSYYDIFTVPAPSKLETMLQPCVLKNNTYKACIAAVLPPGTSETLVKNYVETLWPNPQAHAPSCELKGTEAKLCINQINAEWKTLNTPYDPQWSYLPNADTWNIRDRDEAYCLPWTDSGQPENRFCTWNEETPPSTGRLLDQFYKHGFNLEYDGKLHDATNLEVKNRQLQAQPLWLPWSDIDEYMVKIEASNKWNTDGCDKDAYAYPNGLGLSTDENSLACTDAGLQNRPKHSCPEVDPTGSTQRNRWFVAGKNANRWLWKCSPCSMYKEAVPATMALPRMGCRFAGNEANFTQSNVDHALEGMRDAPYLQARLQHEARAVKKENGTVVQVLEAVETPAFLRDFAEFYGVAAAGQRETRGGYQGYNPEALLLWEQQAWDNAVKHPDESRTMYCQARAWTEEDMLFCNTKLDARRQAVAAAVQSVFREQEGLSLPVVPAGVGMMWQTSVSHADVHLFSLLWGSAEREENKVLTRRLLGTQVCGASDASYLLDRMCVTSVQSVTGFEPLHPWVGGDFNALLQKDTCPLLANEGVVSLCPCNCEPKWACGNASEVDFPDDAECQREQFVTTRMLQASDPSNLCALASAMKLPKYCTHMQGLAFSNPSVPTGRKSTPRDPVTQQQLYSEEGVRMSYHVVQGMYDASNALWVGGVAQTTKGAPDYGFLSVPHDGLPHPAHLAFGVDDQRTGTPMVLQGIQLLGPLWGDFVPPTDDRVSNPEWLSGLSDHWARELMSVIEPLYPQLRRTVRKKGDWSCPLRELVFWGGVVDGFSPLVPDPILAQQLYGLGGVHPLIEAVPLGAKLAAYTTTTGVCYADGTNFVAQKSHPCSLLGTLRWLGSALPTPMQVMHAFADRCMDTLDTPVLAAKLRSGETTTTTLRQPEAACGVLHRLSPFLLRVRGDAGRIRKLVGTRTHTTPGADCFMGRAFLLRVGEVLGAGCALMENRTALRCASTDPNSEDALLRTLSRAKPLSLAELLVRARTLRRVYKTDALRGPTFLGPGGLALPLPEVSFGRLYTPTLVQALVSDLVATCQSTPGCNVTSLSSVGGFWEDYASGKLLSTSRNYTSTTDSEPLTRAARQQDGLTLDREIWAKPWAWRFDNQTRGPAGVVNESRWRSNRYAACSESLADHVKDKDLSKSVHDIDLCTATGGLQNLCQNLDAFRTQEVFRVNCEHAGKGDCPINLGFFYVPSLFFPQNNEYASETVASYYQWVVERELGTSQAWTQLACPQLDALEEQQRVMRLAVRSLCPASQLESIKLLLELLKTVGTKMIDFMYHYFSMFIDFFGMVMVKSATQTALLTNDLKGHIDALFSAILEIFPMLVDVVVNIFMQMGSIGPILKTILTALCIALNWVVDNIVVNVWCMITKPILLPILDMIKGIVKVVSFGNDQIPNALGGMVDIIVSFGDGTGESCARSIRKHLLKCDFGPPEMNTSSNSGVSPLATMCWARSPAANSLLTCTQADTCASSPINFAAGLNAAGESNLASRRRLLVSARLVVSASTNKMQRHNVNKATSSCFGDCIGQSSSVEEEADTSSSGQRALVPCGQCEVFDPSFHTKPFDCDVYLKRCTCGAKTTSLGECMTNADCNAPGAECGFSSDVADVRDSFASTPCALCPQSGLNSICVIDGRSKMGGVCACDRLPGSLHQCKAELAGKPVYNLQSMCAVVMDQAKRTHLMTYSNAPGALVWSFSNDMAVTPCTLGSVALCLPVQLPVSASGTHKYHLVVVLDLLNVADTLSWSSRRLLSSTTSAQFEHIANNLVVPDYLDRAQAKEQLSINVAVTAAAMRCNLTSSWVSHTLHLVVAHPQLVHALWSCSSLRDVVLVDEPKSPVVETKQGGSGRRLLQQEQVQQPEAQSQCLIYDVAASQMIQAFAMTSAYYKERREPLLGSQECLWPPATTHLPDGVLPWVADRLFFAVSMGRVGGHQFADAMLVSNMTYNDSVRLNYMTGRRMLQELGACNFSRLLDSAALDDDSRVMRSLISLLLVCLAVQFLFGLSGCLAMGLWGGIFPIVLFWSLYQVSPLCWPMVPVQFPTDVVQAAERYLRPFAGEMPPVMLRANCTSAKEPGCVLSCHDAPFHMTSAPDALAWWLCEWSTDLCTSVARTAGGAYRWAGLDNFVSSATYYAEVLTYAADYDDDDFASAHRWCAVFASYRLLLNGCLLLGILALLPVVTLTFLDLVVTVLGFMWDTAA